MPGNRGWLSDRLGLRDGNLGLLNGRVMVLRSTANHLWDWEDRSCDLELAGVDIRLVRGAEERLGELSRIGQLVGVDSVGHWSLLDNRRRLVVAGILQEGVASPGSLEEHSHLLGSVAEADTYSSLWVSKLGPRAAPTTPPGIRRGL